MVLVQSLANFVRTFSVLGFIGFAQVDPTPVPTPGTGGGGGGGGPGIDVGALANGIVNGILNGLQNVLITWTLSLPKLILDGIQSMVTNLWNAIWGSGFNLLATPFNLTIDFPPAQLLGNNLIVLVYSIAFISVVLLALRMLWRTLTGSGGVMHDAIDGVLYGVLLSSVSSLIVGQAFLLLALASDAIGRINYAPSFQPQTLLTIGPDFFLGVFALIVMVVYGWRLWLRAAYRIVLLMFLAPFAPIAGILWAIPQLRWVAVLYWVMFGGWLAGGFLAIGAVSLAAQFGSMGGSTIILQLIFGVALIQVAYDLMAILPKGAVGGIQVGSPFSGLLAGAAGGAVVAAATGAAPSIASAVAGGGGSAGTALATIGGGSTELAGYGY